MQEKHLYEYAVSGLYQVEREESQRDCSFVKEAKFIKMILHNK
jgi:hypothetical protein